MNRVFKALAIAFTVVVALVSCKKEDQPKEVALTGIELNATSQTLQVGQEFQLTVTYKPENATNKPAATWASDTPAVATVDGGKVVAVAAGTAKITATVGTFKAECAVTVASAEEEILPVEGNSDWSIIGALLGANWDKDFVAAKDGDIYVVKNVKLAAADQFKFRKDKDWGVNRGAEGDVEPFKLTAGTAITVINNGKNLAAPGDGIYDIYYNAAVEQVCLVAKDGTPKWNEPEVKGLIDIDGDFSDWAEIEAVGKGTHAAFKVAVDDNYLYVYTKRIKGEGEAASGYEEMWGHASEGYIYLALDLDKDPETGDMLWSNGPFEFVGYHYPFGGSAESPAINEKPGANTSCAPSTASTKNIFCKGAIGTDEVEIEYRIPRADLPEIPETPFIVYSWGSLGLDKVEYHVGEPQPAPEYVHDYTPSAEYLAETNLWKAVDAAGSDFFIINCINGEWPRSAEASSEGVYALTHEQSTYKMHYDVASTEDWQRQLFLFPKAENAIAIEEGEKYNVKVTFYANKDLPRVFMKVVNYQADKDNKEGAPVLFGDEIKSVKAGQPTVFEYKDVAGVANTENLTFVIDFGGAPADVDIYVKDIIIEKIVPAAPTPTDFAALADNEELTFEGIVASVAKNGVVVTDGTTNIYVFKPATTPAIGDKVSVKATKTTYYKLIETKQGAEVTVLSSGNEVLYTEPVDITDTFDAYPDTEHTSDLLSVTGELVVDGSYVNLNVAGATARQGSLQGVDITALNGKKIKLFGYYIGTSGSGGKFLTISVVSAEEVAAAPANITIDGDFSEWAGVPSAPESDSFKAFKVWNDADNFYVYLETDPGSRLWSGGAYLYLYFDLDNDLTTGDCSGSTGMGSNKYEAFVFMYLFGGSADAPVIENNPNGGDSKGMTLDNIVIAGNNPATKSDLVIMEIKVPRANFTTQVSAGDVIGVNAYRSKDGGNVNFPGYVVK